MRAVVSTEPGKLEVIDVAPPAVGPYQALVQTEIAVLCNATDSKLVGGHFPGVNTFPMVLGHEGAGIVRQAGAKVRSFKVGDRAIGGLVFQFAEPTLASAWGGFCEYTLVNDHDAMVADGVADFEHGWFECYEIQRPVPADIRVEDAALLCTWREVYGAFGDFNLKKGDRILVFGAGPVGLSFVKFARLLGLSYIAVVDPIEKKRQKALEMGADAVFAGSADLANKFSRSFDAVIDAVGSEAIINAAIPLVKMGGSVCVYGVVSADCLSLNKSDGPYNFNFYIHQWPTRFRERAAMAPLCEWIRAGKLKADEFVTHRFNMEEVADAFEEVKKGRVVKALLRY